ncbi:MAG: DUF1631 family protein [Marinicellaceae bacterium]
MVKMLNPVSNKILNQTLSYFGQELKPMMVNYFDSLEYLINELTEKSDSETKQKFYLESNRSIKVHKLNVLVSYLKTIQNVFKSFINKEYDYFQHLNSSHQNKAVSFQVNTNDLDEKMLQDNLIHAYEKKNKKNLAEMTHYFSALFEENVEPQHNPISPFVLTTAFAKSIRLLHLDQKVKIILYKHFELNILSKLESMYKEAVENISAFIKKNNANTEKKEKPKKQASKKFTITKQEIMGYLEELQAKPGESKVQKPHVIKSALMAKLERIQLEKSHRITNQDLYNIDFVTLRFQIIVEDNNLHESIKNSVCKLHIPYLKYSMTDDSIIEDKSHPALLLLKEIRSASIGWSEKHDANQVFFKNLNNMVNTICQSNSLNKTLFQVILKDYIDFNHRQKNEFSKEQERIQKREKGKSKIISAMKTVDALIDLKTENKTLPLFIKDILFGPWKNLLSLLLVRYSDTAEEYLEMVVFIDDILDLLSSEQYDVIKVSQIGKLSDVFKQGLELVAYSGDVLDGKVKKFTDKFMKFHKLGDYSTTKSTKQVISDSDNIETKQHNSVSAELGLPNDLQQDNALPKIHGFNKTDSLLLATVPIGTWVEIHRPNNSSVLAQLSWVNPKSGKYIFVNERGLKVTDKSQKEMLKDLKNKKIIVSKI